MREVDAAVAAVAAGDAREFEAFVSSVIDQKKRLPSRRLDRKLHPRACEADQRRGKHSDGRFESGVM